jgi:hypothetical protein
MFLLYVPVLNPRIRYVTDFIGRELFGSPLLLATDSHQFQSHTGPKVSYAPERIIADSYHIQCVGLLFETGVRSQPLQVSFWEGHKIFFPSGGDLPFDLLAAVFFLLSRYEEYLPYEQDEYGRFSHRSSLAWKEGFLHQPLINSWIATWKDILQERFPDVQFRQPSFSCLLTYDIDQAYAYREKGLFRTLGGLVKSVFTRPWSATVNRWTVIKGKKPDPYDCFEWLDALHLYCRTQPLYFFLVAKQYGRYDKNNVLTSPRFRRLIEYCSKQYAIGLHPSWRSFDEPGLLTEEREWLEVISEQSITVSRQHYLRFTLPQTYRRLLEAGLTREYSMGYGTVNGFRASVASPFYWFNLEQESSTALQLFPFCYMDANSFFEQKQSPAEAYRELMEYYQSVKKVKGLFITVWHNSVLGTSAPFSDWRNLFEVFMKEVVYWDAGQS